MIPESFQVCYDKLWRLLSSRKMKKKDLQSKTKLSSAVIAKLGKGLPVHLNTLLKICSVLHCTLDDIVDVGATLPDHV
ncbi:MAG: helix-turn-helix transcriptional regulator [Clostridia bacterium]|jgi:DNA (cytosine-5)-methyltransferase 1|nr:helix-turn-helix transcriptional regulator [Clostridia bacterium]